MECKLEHENEGLSKSGITEATLIKEEILRSAVEVCKSRTFPDDDVLLPSEPVLSACVRYELLKISGKLALSGAGPDIVVGVAADAYNTVLIAVTAVRMGYARLLEGLLLTSFKAEEQK